MSTNVSSVVNHFPSAEGGFTTTTSGAVSSGASTVGINSAAGYANGEIVVFVIDPSDATKKQVFTGVMDTAGLQVTGVVWTSGTNQAHVSGATVVDYATATHISMVTKGILVAHEQTGVHKSGATYPLPVITDFTNANHNHSNAAGGGQISGSAAITAATITGALLGKAQSVKAVQSSGQVIATGSETAVNFDAETWDTDGFHSNVTNNSRLIVPAGMGGIYLCWAQLQHGSVGDAGSRYGRIYVNGSAANMVAVGNSSNNNDPTGQGNLNLSGFVVLSAGDYIQVNYYQGSGGNVTMSTGTYGTSLGMVRIGNTS